MYEHSVTCTTQKKLTGLRILIVLITDIILYLQYVEQPYIKKKYALKHSSNRQQRNNSEDNVNIKLRIIVSFEQMKYDKFQSLDKCVTCMKYWTNDMSMFQNIVIRSENFYHNLPVITSAI